jgi:hypothetical protein
MLTREQELEQLAAFRRLTRDDWKVLATTGASRDESVGLRDQQRAAIEEMRQLTPYLSTAVSRPGVQEPAQPVKRRAANTPDALALIMAGMKRCDAGHACPHVGTGDRPLVYYFAARVVSCKDCMPRFRGPLMAQHRRVQEKTDTECDFCLTTGHEKFTTVMRQCGPALIHADICTDCQRIVFEKE